MNVQRDTGSSGVIVWRNLMDETHMTGEMGHGIIIDSKITSAPIARINVDTLYYARAVKVFAS